MIRKAIQADVAQIVAMGEKFHQEAGWGDICDFVAEDCAATISNMIEQAAGIVLSVEGDDGLIGMAGAVLSPLYFNYSHIHGQELFFWMKPDSRFGMGRSLKRALENEAMEQGCHSFAMIALDKIRPEATGMLYKRDGYRASEHSWIKRL